MDGRHVMRVSRLREPLLTKRGIEGTVIAFHSLSLTMASPCVGGFQRIDEFDFKSNHSQSVIMVISSCGGDFTS